MDGTPTWCGDLCHDPECARRLATPSFAVKRHRRLPRDFYASSSGTAATKLGPIPRLQLSLGFARILNKYPCVGLLVALRRRMLPGLARTRTHGGGLEVRVDDFHGGNRMAQQRKNTL